MEYGDLKQEIENLKAQLNQIGKMVNQLQQENIALKSLLARTLPADQLGNNPEIAQQAERDALAAQFR